MFDSYRDSIDDNSDGALFDRWAAEDAADKAAEDAAMRKLYPFGDELADDNGLHNVDDFGDDVDWQEYESWYDELQEYPEDFTF